jgi:Na+-transporting NADH:ubiquinone oxidoreductase subunit E
MIAPQAPDIHPLLILFGAMFTENILLANYLGMCSFLAVSRDVKPAIGLGAAVTLVLTIASALNYLVYWHMLAPWELGHLQFIAFMLIIAATVQVLEMVIERFSPRLYYALGIYLPLITVNCAILGGCLFMVIRQYNFLQSVAYGAGGGLGWWLAILAMAGIQQRLQHSRIPKGLQGPGITLIIAGIMALAFTGLAGMVSIR